MPEKQLTQRSRLFVIAQATSVTMSILFNASRVAGELIHHPLVHELLIQLLHML